MIHRSPVLACALLLACGGPAQEPGAPVQPAVAPVPRSDAPPPVMRPGERPPPGHPPEHQGAAADERPPPSVLDAGPHPFGEILGIDPSLAVQPDSPDLDYPLDKLWRMAGSARDVNRKPAEVMALLKLQEGDVVADVGAGSGYHTWHLSRAVGATGEVWASEILLDSLEFMRMRLGEEPPPHPNIHLLLHDRRDLLLPESSIDLALLVNVHFFAYPVGPPMKDQSLEDVVRFYRSIHRALEPGGRMAILEREANFERMPQGSITAEQIAEQLGQAGFVLKEQHRVVDGEYFLVFAAE